MKYQGGALLPGLLEPGFHLVMPLLQEVTQVQIALSTDLVENVACGTKSGIELVFERVEVVSVIDMQAVHEAVKLYSPGFK